MHFGMKNILKSNHNHTPKHALIKLISENLKRPEYQVRDILATQLEIELIIFIKIIIFFLILILI